VKLRFISVFLLVLALFASQQIKTSDFIQKHYKKFGTLAALYVGHKGYLSFNQYGYRHQKKISIDTHALPDDAPVVTLFAHGILGNRNSPNRYKRHECIVGSYIGFDFLNSKLLEDKRQSASLAQKADIERLAQEYKKAVKKGYKVILHGVSRGASTVINFMGTYNTKNVVAVIAESPFDDIKTVIQHVLKQARLHWVPGLSTLGTFVCSLIFHRNYSPYGIRPIDVVHKIDKNIPIFITSTQQDELTPAHGSKKLYNTLIAAGHPKAHFLMVPHGEHANIIGGPSAQAYRNDIHAFLRKYGLHHTSVYAFASRHPDFKFRIPSASIPGIRQIMSSHKKISRSAGKQAKPTPRLPLRSNLTSHRPRISPNKENSKPSLWSCAVAYRQKHALKI
jgi:alpha-beta hydrolase superfamily lysophospholipase